MGDSGIPKEEIKCWGSGSAAPVGFPPIGRLQIVEDSPHKKLIQRRSAFRTRVRFRLITFLFFHIGTSLKQALLI